MTLPCTRSEDLRLWLLLKKGDREAFAALFEKYHKNLYNYGVKVAPVNPDIVEDAIQDLFIDIWRLRGGLTEKVESVRFYLYRALRRKIHITLNKDPNYRLTDVFDEKYFFQKSYEADLIRSETTGQLETRLSKLINQLPRRQKEALTLRYFDGFSNPEIAVIMEVSEKSVRNFLYKALSHLRTHQAQICL